MNHIKDLYRVAERSISVLQVANPPPGPVPAGDGGCPAGVSPCAGAGAYVVATATTGPRDCYAGSLAGGRSDGEQNKTTAKSNRRERR